MPRKSEKVLELCSVAASVKAPASIKRLVIPFVPAVAA